VPLLKYNSICITSFYQYAFVSSYIFLFSLFLYFLDPLLISSLKAIGRKFCKSEDIEEHLTLYYSHLKFQLVLGLFIISV
jgi:hypothetical protein